MVEATPDPGKEFDAARRGFSAKAGEYDALAETDPVNIWMRRRIWALVEERLAPGGSILELNAGSGVDAAHFAAAGYRVHATDIAPGMLAALEARARQPEAGGRLSVEARSFTELQGVSGGPYDLVFSNLGGLNCIDDLTAVTRGLPGLLKPGGSVVWVIMPPVCPWELLQALRGHWRTATRRLKRDGTLAHVEGAMVPTWYHAPGSVQRALGPRFRTLTVRSFGCFSPPSFFTGFVRRHPGLTRRLMQIDDAIGERWPFNRCGDFYAIVAQMRPSPSP
jgi:ubiquinone/menaquinone biosynthesis C-methylase UbiE